MKKVLLIAASFCLLLAATHSSAQAQCVPDPSINSPGIYPSSDSLPDGVIGTPYNEVVQFAFPPDTTISGFTLDFDSFLVIAVNNVPTWATWQCDQWMNNCTYYTNPPQLTRGCVSITGTPNAIFNDSVEVVGQAWVTIPFVGPQAINDTIRLNLRILDSTTTAITPNFAYQLDLTVSPNPIASNSRVSFNLPFSANVEVGVFDMYGREVAQLANGEMNAGYKQLNLGKYASQLSEGIYFLKFNANHGEFVTTRKLLSVH